MWVDGWTNLSGRAKFLLTGPDAERYLNGQTTNDVRRAVDSAAMASLITTAKGKVEADIFLSRRGPEGFFIDGPEDLRMALNLRLDRYLIADNAELIDVTEEFQLFHGLGTAPAAPPAAMLRTANRYGVEGWDLIVSAGAEFSPGGKPLSPEIVEAIRVAHRIPQWGAELTPDVLPHEARLDDRCLDFHKGCYIGQEVISRIKSVGRVNRLLCAMVAAPGDNDLAVGQLLFLQDREVGVVTSVAKNTELNRMTALGYVKRDAASPGTHLQATNSEKRLSTDLEIRETPLCS